MMKLINKNTGSISVRLGGSFLIVKPDETFFVSEIEAKEILKKHSLVEVLVETKKLPKSGRNKRIGDLENDSTN